MERFDKNSPEQFADVSYRNKVEVALIHAYGHDLALKLERMLVSIGLTIPKNHNLFWPINRGGIQRLFDSYLDHLVRKINSYDPGEIIYAYARHAGLPSELLDWSYDYEVAAFFACFENNSNDQDNDAVVWAINQNVTKETDLRKHVQDNAAVDQIQFMQKQSALFLFDWKRGDYFIENSRWRSFEDIFMCSIAEKDMVYCLILPSEEKSNLKRFLSKRRVTKSRLMPTIYTAAEDVLSGNIGWLDDSD